MKNEKNKTFSLNAACVCHNGKVRLNNEDNFYFDGIFLPADHRDLNEPKVKTSDFSVDHLFAIFDGMGGESNGEIASFIAAYSLSEFQKRIKSIDDNFSADIFLSEYIQNANDLICKEMNNSRISRMGSTAAILYFNQESTYVCNTGDSRVYLFRNDNLKQISTDHTDLEHIKKFNLKRKPKLTQHLGIFKDEMMLEPFISNYSLQEKDRFLICSDGLNDLVSNGTISHILTKRQSAQEAVQDLLDLTLVQGANDNVTIIVIDIIGKTSGTSSVDLPAKINLKKMLGIILFTLILFTNYFGYKIFSQGNKQLCDIASNESSNLKISQEATKSLATLYANWVKENITIHIHILLIRLKNDISSLGGIQIKIKVIGLLKEIISLSLMTINSMQHSILTIME